MDSSSFFSLIPSLLASAPVCLSVVLFILCSLSYDSLKHVLVSACVLVFVYTSAQCTPVHIDKKKSEMDTRRCWPSFSELAQYLSGEVGLGLLVIEIFWWYDIHDIKANLNESFEDKLCSVCTHVVILT